jgi:hypothetical protein
MDRWGQYFKPAGMSQNTGDPNTARKAAPTPVIADDFDDEPVTATAPKARVEETKSSGDSKANDILAMIRNRKAS